MEERTFCVDVARELHEPLAGTAPTADRWLLVEVPGSWGAAGLTASALPEDVSAELARRCTAAGVRVQLLRRPDRSEEPGPGDRAVYLANCRADAPWVVRVDTPGSPQDLLDLPLDATNAPLPPTHLGRSVSEPVILVCTHAKRDVCCAIHGQAAYRALHGHRQAEVWETSHTGGHRFAPNLVVLPYGLTFGWVDPSWANHLVTGLLSADVDIAQLRGRAGIARALQAAELAARHVTTDTSLRGPTIVGAEVEGALSTVTLVSEGQEVVVQVLETEAAGERVVSCTKGDISVPTAYEILHAAVV